MRAQDFAKMRALREVTTSEPDGAGRFTRYYDECTGQVYDVDLQRGRFRKVHDLGADCGQWEVISRS